MSNYILTTDGELYHYGVKGMKWGVRKAQKQYKKYAIAYENDALKSSQKLSLDAYNKTADEYNNGKTAEFNKKHNPKSKTYMDDLNRQFEQDYRRNFDKMKLNEMMNNPNFKKAQAISKKYDLTKVDELAKRNEQFVTELKKAISEGKTSWDIMGKYEG